MKTIQLIAAAAAGKTSLMAAAAVVLMLGACGADGSRTYEMPVEKAFNKVRDVSYSGRRVGDERTQLYPTTYKIIYDEPKKIEWRFTRDASYPKHDLVTATFEAVDADTTRIHWEHMATESDFVTIDEERNKKIRMWDNVRLILREHVDSTLTDRPFDGQRIVDDRS
jgi:hypothetical protein